MIATRETARGIPTQGTAPGRSITETEAPAPSIMESPGPRRNWETHAMPTARCFVHIRGRGPTPATLTTDHGSSSYGVPVLLLDDTPHGPGDATSFGVQACYLFLTLDPRDGEEGARLLGAWQGAQDCCRRHLREDAR